ARLAPLRGRLRDLLPAAHELWLDGGHNAHGAAALARALAEMQAARPAPLVMILGMMNTRSSADFLQPFAGRIRRLLALDIPGEVNAHPAAAIADAARGSGIDAAAMPGLMAALEDAARIEGARVVICGSLYLAGHVLAA